MPVLFVYYVYDNPTYEVANKLICIYCLTHLALIDTFRGIVTFGIYFFDTFSGVVTFSGND